MDKPTKFNAMLRFSYAVRIMRTKQARKARIYYERQHQNRSYLTGNITY